MSKIIVKNCEECGVPFKTEKSRFCSRECRSGIYKGGKTFDEIRLAVISKINDRWVNSPSSKKRKEDHTNKTFTNY